MAQLPSVVLGPSSMDWGLGTHHTTPESITLPHDTTALLFEINLPKLPPKFMRVGLDSKQKHKIFPVGHTQAPGFIITYTQK